MAGNTVRPALIGVGLGAPAGARDPRAAPRGGGPRHEASRRATARPRGGRVRALPGEVYIRGGPADLRPVPRPRRRAKVLAAYARHAEDPEPPPPPAKAGRVEQALAAARIRDSQKFFLIAAAVVLMVLVAVGLVSRDGAPAVADLPSATATVTAVATDAALFTLVLEARAR